MTEVICSTRSDELELSINHFDEGSDDVASKLAALLTTQRGRKLLTRIVACHCGGRTHAESLCLPLGFEARLLLAQMPQMEVAQIALNYCDCIALQCPITCTCLDGTSLRQLQLWLWNCSKCTSSASLDRNFAATVARPIIASSNTLTHLTVVDFDFQTPKGHMWSIPPLRSLVHLRIAIRTMSMLQSSSGLHQLTLALLKVAENLAYLYVNANMDHNAFLDLAHCAPLERLRSIGIPQYHHHESRMSTMPAFLSDLKSLKSLHLCDIPQFIISRLPIGLHKLAFLGTGDGLLEFASKLAEPSYLPDLRQITMEYHSGQPGEDYEAQEAVRQACKMRGIETESIFFLDMEWFRCALKKSITQATADGVRSFEAA